MADFLEIPYARVALAAAIPACLYFLADFMAIHFYAVQNNLLGEPRDKLPRLWSVLKSRGYFLIPIFGIVYALGNGYSPTMAGYTAIVLSFLTSFFRKETFMGPKRIFATLSKAGEGFGEIAVASACAGIIMGVLGLTGLGPRLSGVLVELSGHSTFLLLILTAITSLIMGMGVPTTVAYITLATLVAPALREMGNNLLASHLFIFYFGMISMITPPVAMAAYAAAAIARCDYNKVGWTAFRFSLPSLFVAFFFVYNPGLLFVDGPAGAVVPTLRCLVATISMAASTSGWLIKRANLPQRILLFSGAMGALHVNLLTDILGIIALLIVGFWQWMEKRKEREWAAGSEEGV
jgi:TRAP transporter 4TM/12TM fusion protein